jgi:hypothetical protein
MSGIILLELLAMIVKGLIGVLLFFLFLFGLGWAFNRGSRAAEEEGQLSPREVKDISETEIVSVGDEGGKGGSLGGGILFVAILIVLLLLVLGISSSNFSCGGPGYI